MYILIENNLFCLLFPFFFPLSFSYFSILFDFLSLFSGICYQLRRVLKTLQQHYEGALLTTIVSHEVV